MLTPTLLVLLWQWRSKLQNDRIYERERVFGPLSFFVTPFVGADLLQAGLDFYSRF